MANQKDNLWSITIDSFEAGFAPLAFTDSLTEIGSSKHARTMQNVDILDGKIPQGAGLETLTNGDQGGVVNEQINFIMDKAVASDVSYAIGDTKLFKISSTTVASGGTPSFPVTITNCTEGESIQVLKGNLYAFYNKSSEGDI